MIRMFSPILITIWSVLNIQALYNGHFLCSFYTILTIYEEINKGIVKGNIFLQNISTVMMPLKESTFSYNHIIHVVLIVGGNTLPKISRPNTALKRNGTNAKVVTTVLFQICE